MDTALNITESLLRSPLVIILDPNSEFHISFSIHIKSLSHSLPSPKHILNIMYTEPRQHPHQQAESMSAPNETSPLLSASAKPAQPRTSWTLPDFLRATPKKKQDVEERSTVSGPENPEGGLSHRNETRDEAAPKNVSVKSVVAVLFFGILPPHHDGN